MSNKLAKYRRRKRRVRSKIFGTKDSPRLSVFRSNKYIYAQIIDDTKGETLVAVSEKDVKLDSESGTAKKRSKKRGVDEGTPAVPGKYSKTDRAKLVGELLAKKAKRKKITKAVFDRGGYKYHGRVKALAEGARKGGLKF